MQTISKYFVAFLLTVLSSVFGDGEAEEKEKESVFRSTIDKEYKCTFKHEATDAHLLLI